MKKSLYDSTKMMHILIATSILMFVSIFVGAFTTPKIMGIGLLIWFVNLTWIMHLLMRGHYNAMAEHHENNVNKLKKEKKYFTFGVYSVALPMSFVGIIIVIISIGTLFFI